MPRVNRHDNWVHTYWREPYHSAWKVAIAPGDVFQVGGPAGRLQPRTVWNNERSFGRYQEFLARTGRRDEGVLPDLDNLRAFDSDLADLAPYSQVSILTQITGALRLMFPDADLHYLNKVAQRKASIAEPTRPVSSRMIDPVNLTKIACAIMGEVAAKKRPGHRDPNRFMVGTLINAATLFPLRLNNWRIAIIGRHINLETGDVRFSAKEMKRKKPFEGTLSPEALEPLRIFVVKYRPLLLDPDAVDEGYLWPSRTGGMCHRNTLGRAVKDEIRRRTGKEFNFHLFRHGAATFISETKPEQTRMAAGVLHHGSLRTSDKYYIKGRRHRAIRLFQGAVREVMSKGRRKTARRQSKRPQPQSHSRRNPRRSNKR